MNNGEKEIARLIKDAENELRNLKTAHQRPLGALSFFRGYTNIPVNLTLSYGTYVARISVTVRISKPDATPPIVQTGWDVPSGFITVWYDGMTINADYDEWTYDLMLYSNTIGSTTLRVGVISSEPVISVTGRVS